MTLTTTGLGVAAVLAVEGNTSLNPVQGYNQVVLSLSTAGAPTTFQLTPTVQDVSGVTYTPPTATALVLTAVAGSSPGPLTLTSVAAGTGVYTGTITGGGSNAFAGYTFTISGFTNGANNTTTMVTASTTTTLTTKNVFTVAETHAGTAIPEQGTAVYTGTITGGGSSALAGMGFTVAGFVTNPSNNGSFLATASTTTTLTLQNSDAIAETHAATAITQESTGDVLSYYSYNPSIVTVSSTGLLTAVSKGYAVVECAYPVFSNLLGNVTATGLPLQKIFAEVNVSVLI